jgi:hypothetical protein
MEADPAEVNGSTVEGVDAEVEPITGADGPAEADGPCRVVTGEVAKRMTGLRARSPYRGGESVGVKLT